MNFLGIQAQGIHLEFPLNQKDYEEYAAAGLELEQGKYVGVHPC